MKEKVRTLYLPICHSILHKQYKNGFGGEGKSLKAILKIIIFNSINFAFYKRIFGVSIKLLFAI